MADKFNGWVQIMRGKNSSVTKYDDFGKFVKYAMKNGFKFSYLMNSPKPFSEKDFKTFKNEFIRLLDYIYEIGIRDIKVSNPQVANLINEYMPNGFNLQVSTAFELYMIGQYNNLFKHYPNFNFIDITQGQNHNFKFLKSLRSAFPDKKLELMVNEGCRKDCPARVPHIAEPLFCTYPCDLLGFHNFVKKGNIYPWDLEYYSAIGINNFKWVVRDNSESIRSNYTDITYLENYLVCVDKGTDEYSAEFLFAQILASKMQLNKELALSELIQYLPDIKHFIAHGHECAVKCGVECNYCELCAKRTQNFLFG